MSLLRSSISISLDGFVAGPNQSLENPLGVGGLDLHQWVFPTRSFRAMHGDDGGGETGINDDVIDGMFVNVGASIMGRNMFSPVRGPWDGNAWTGWWGDTPPFHHPVFVLTHHAREPLVMQGGTTFYFVTDGIESALAQARRAAAGKDISVGGGASTVRQYLAAGLLDEIDLHIAPRILGSGERLFEGLDPAKVKLEPIRTLEGPGVTHAKYRVLKS